MCECGIHDWRPEIGDRCRYRSTDGLFLGMAGVDFALFVEQREGANVKRVRLRFLHPRFGDDRRT